MIFRSNAVRAALLSTPLAVTAPPATAHHGQEFVVVMDSSVPSMWSGTVFGGIEWSRDGRLDEISAEPGFLLGLGSRVAVGATLGFSGTEDDWGYESISPFVQFQITPPSWPVRVAVMAGHHFADTTTTAEPAPTSTRPAPRPTSSTSTTPRPPAPPPDPPVDPDPPCGPEFGPDAPPCPEPAPATPGRKLRHAGHVTPDPAPAAPATNPAPASKSSSAAPASKQTDRPPAPPERYDGIHRHGEDHAYARFILEADLGPSDSLLFNLIGLWPENGGPAWGYAAGYKHRFSHALAAGIEAIGDFGNANEHELVAAGYFTPTHHLSLKLGAGIGLTDASPDVSLRTGVVWRF